MTERREPVRYYSERENPFHSPPQNSYATGPNGEPIIQQRDDRMSMSVEWAAEHGIPVPANWREFK